MSTPARRSCRRLLAAAVALAVAGATTPAVTDAGGESAPGSPPWRFTEAIVYRSTGTITCRLGRRDRDRTITMVPVLLDARKLALDVSIVDHEDDDRIISGRLSVDPQGAVTAARPELINVANILAVTPRVLRTLRSSGSPVSHGGQAEVAGTVHDVSFSHELVGDGPAGTQRIRTATGSADGRFALETVVDLAPDGLPVTAVTRGTIRSFALLTVDLMLVRSRREDAGAAPGARARARPLSIGPGFLPAGRENLP
jgi:hypothetical protein